MKNTLLALLGFILLSTPSPATAQWGEFTWTRDGEAMRITGYTGSGGDVEIPDIGFPTEIGNWVFYNNTNLTSITIPSSVLSIGSGAFYNCTNLTRVFFRGNQPWYVAFGAFQGATNAIVYYLPGTSWGPYFSGLPTRLQDPLIEISDPNVGVGPGGFGFAITATEDIPIVVEATTNLANATWVPVRSLNLTNGWCYFSDPNWTNYPVRFYRIRSQ